MKTRIFALIAILALAPIFGQQATPEPTAEQMKQLATIIRSQRDALSQQLLDMQSQLQLANAENESLKKQLVDLQKKIEDAKPKPVTPSESKPAPKP